MRSMFVAVLVLAFGMSGIPLAHAVDIHGNDVQDTYSGVGGLVLPASTEPHTRREVATCQDCSWQVSDACDTPYGNAFLRCRSDVLRCSSGSEEKRAWMRLGDGLWHDRGLLCVSSGGPPTVASVGREARGAFVQHLPNLAPSSRPAQGVVTQLPVIFDSGQPDGTWTFDAGIAGANVHLEAQPRWSWDFGDGSTVTADAPGGLRPGVGLGHTYRQSGRQTVRVVTWWTASFWIDGLGPFPVAEEVSQQAAFSIRVGEGRAALMEGR